MLATILPGPIPTSTTPVGTKVDLSQTLNEQGIETYAGYGWYRLRLRPAPVPESGVLSLSLMLIPYSVGQIQVLANGTEIGHTLGMRDPPHMYQATPISVPLGRVGADGTVLIAIRSWIGFLPLMVSCTT